MRPFGQDSVRNCKRTSVHNTVAAEPADSAEPRVWIKTAIFCSTLTRTGCLAAGRTRKTFGPVLTRGGVVFRSAFTSLNAGLHEALVVGEFYL